MNLEKHSKFAISDDMLFEIACGHIPGYTPAIAFGNNPVAGTALATVWDEAAASPLYVYPSIASQMYVTSADAKDTLAGVGAQKAFVAGLNALGYWQYEIVEMNGLAGVLTEKTYSKVNTFYVYQVGASKWNEGKMYVGTGTITDGVPANIFASLDGTSNTRDNSMKQAVFTVPKGYKALVVQILLGSGQGKEVSLGLYFGDGLPMKSVGELTIYESAIQMNFPIPLAFPELTNIELRSFAAGTLHLRAGFQMILVREDKSVPFILPGSFMTSDAWVA
jgi:hypothetical protein